MAPITPACSLSIFCDDVQSSLSHRVTVDEHTICDSRLNVVAKNFDYDFSKILDVFEFERDEDGEVVVESNEPQPTTVASLLYYLPITSVSFERLLDNCNFIRYILYFFCYVNDDVRFMEILKQGSIFKHYAINPYNDSYYSCDEGFVWHKVFFFYFFVFIVI